MGQDMRQYATVRWTYTDADGEERHGDVLIRALATDSDEAIIKRAMLRDHRTSVASGLPTWFDDVKVVERDNFNVPNVNYDEVKVGDVVTVPAAGNPGNARVGVVTGIRDAETTSGLPAWAQDLVIVMEEHYYGMSSFSQPSSNMTVIGHVTPADEFLTADEISQTCRKYKEQLAKSA